MTTTLDLFAWLGFIALVWVLRELLLGLWATRKARRFDHIGKVERTRGQFAEVRNSLAWLAAQGGIEPRSATYRKLYFVNTVFMRHPDRYPQLCNAIQMAILTSHDTEPDRELQEESKTWSRETRTLVIHTADAMQQVLIDYSWLFRFYYYLARKKNEFEKRRSNDWGILVTIVAAVKSAAQRVVRLAEQRHEIVFEIRRARAAMYDMAN